MKIDLCKQDLISKVIHRGMRVKVKIRNKALKILMKKFCINQKDRIKRFNKKRNLKIKMTMIKT